MEHEELEITAPHPFIGKETVSISAPPLLSGEGRPVQFFGPLVDLGKWPVLLVLDDAHGKQETVHHWNALVVLPEDFEWGDELKATSFGLSDGGAVHFYHTDGNTHFKELGGKCREE